MKIPAEKPLVDPHAAAPVRPARQTPHTADTARQTAAGQTGQGKPAAGQAADRTADSRGAPVAETRPGRAAAIPAGQADNRLDSLLSALKLPNDSLSESLVSFIRYFSLPLERASPLRREILAQKKPGSSTLEAAALGAAAAADKGLVLEGRALEAYANALDPVEWREQEAGRGNGEAGQEQQEPGQPGAGQQGTEQQGAGQQKPGQQEAEYAPIPDFINRIPGKNGRRWIVVPFSCSDEGFDMRASFRISLPDPDGKSGENGRFAADIAVFRKKKLFRRWFFLLDGSCAGEFKAKRAEFSVSPPVAGGKALIRELAKLFVLPDNKITLNKRGNFADSRNDLLLTVDEEV
ncbi:MAG: hypothetical protein LBG26_04100 [Treponema sp.]|jgi:hypothetical protein|nr:hypothetical protein [Treponema sp.]